MFERFTERAREVVVLAQEEARTLHHNYLGTEHILLGLLREEQGLAARVLEGLNITTERVRAQVVRIVGSGDEVTEGQIPLTPRAKKVLEMALREALTLGHNYIGTEHILLGLARENEGVAARMLLDFGADPEKIRNEVIRRLNGPSTTAGLQTIGELEARQVSIRERLHEIDAEFAVESLDNAEAHRREWTNLNEEWEQNRKLVRELRRRKERLAVIDREAEEDGLRVNNTGWPVSRALGAP